MKSIKQFFWSALITEKIFFRYIIISVLPVFLIALSVILFFHGQALFIFIAPLLASLSAFTLAIEKLSQDEGENKLFLYILASLQATLVYFSATLLLHPLGWLLAHTPFLTGLQGIFWVYREVSFFRFFNEADFIYFVYFMPWFLFIFGIFFYKYKPEYVMAIEQGNSISRLQPEEAVQSNHSNPGPQLSKYFTITFFIALLVIGGWIWYTFVPEKAAEVDDVSKTISSSPVSINDEDTSITIAKKYLSGEPIPWMNDLQAELDTSPDMMDMVLYVKKEEYSIQEISKHSSNQNCWIAYRFHIFDITKLLTLKDFFQSILGLESKCGTDVTEYIDSMPTVAGSLNTARFKYALDLFYIGSISTGSSKSATQNTVLFTDKDNVYSFEYPMEWRLERHTNYIQLYNYPESKVEKAQFGKGENKIEGGLVLNIVDFPDFNSFSATTIADKEIYIKKGGIDGYWDWTQILIPMPGVNEVISFVIYGDMDNFVIMVNTLLKEFVIK
ncbi:MAG: hypothetical protein NUW00_03370 [Candidatus Kaiserbacteria bacterium]|nr:hypothetical protein [Candidatus Kaiserbacteria bacterium]